MAVTLAFHTTYWLLPVLADGDAFAVDAEAIAENVVGCGGICHLEERECLLLLVSATDGGFDPAYRGEGVSGKLVFVLNLA